MTEDFNIIPQTFAFRRMDMSDVDTVWQIEQSSFQQPWSKNMFLNELSLQFSSFFVCSKTDTLKEIVAYGGFWSVVDEAHILNLAVRSDFRKLGIGKKMLEYLLNEARKSGSKTVFLEVRETNVVAKRLYLNFGFKVVGNRKNYYSNNETAIIMMLELLVNKNV